MKVMAFAAIMAENWYANTYYHPAATNINHFMSMINPNDYEQTYGPIFAQRPNTMFINNNESYAGYRGNSYSNQYHSLHNHKKFLYESYSDERKPSLEDLVNEYVNESKRMEAPIDEGKPSFEDLFGEFATTFSIVTRPGITY